MTDYVSALVGGSNGYSGYNSYSGYSGYAGYGINSSASRSNGVAYNFGNTHKVNFEAIAAYLEDGNTNAAMDAYEQLLKAAEEEYPEYDDMEIANILNNASRSTTGMTLTQGFAQQGGSSFWHGIAEGLPIIGLFVNNDTNAEQVAKISGMETPKNEQNKEAIGIGISAGLAGLAAVTFLSGPVGWVTAGAIALCGVLKSATKK